MANDHDDLELVRDAVREAGAVAMHYYGQTYETWEKEGGSPVTQADLAVNDFLRERLRNARPEYGWLSEEDVDDGQRKGVEKIFVVDPIDGTRGFMQSNDLWCISVGIVAGTRPIIGALELPARNQTYFAQLDKGAFKNDIPVKVGQLPERPRITGSKKLINTLKAQAEGSFDVLAFVPSLACRIAMVAEGSLDICLARGGACDWDLAAADIILQEAGGALSDIHTNKPVQYNQANPRHPSLLGYNGQEREQVFQWVRTQSLI